MIKITSLDPLADPIRRLYVEGRVVQRAVGELTSACRHALTNGGPVLLDLSGVSFVDADGARAIAELTDDNITPIGCSPFVGAILRSHATAGGDRDAAQDPALVPRLRRREPGACEDVVRRHGGGLLALARRVLRSDDAAHEAVREGFRRAFAALDDDDGRVELAILLRRMVAAAALARLRRRTRARATPVEHLRPTFDDTGHRTSPVNVGGATDDDVRHCLDRLPELDRAILVLHDGEDLDAAALADVLGTTVTTLRARVHRARQALRALLTRTVSDRPAPRRARR